MKYCKLKSVLFLSKNFIIGKFLIKKIEDYIFDKENNIVTRGDVKKGKLQISKGQSYENATYYQGVNIRYLKSLFQGLKIYGDDFRFVDVGCGKGRACFYAAKYYKKVTGLDFSSELIENARINFNNCKNKKYNIDFKNADAVNYILPDEACIVYLFNPFNKIIFEKFIENNYNNFKKNKSILALINSDFINEDKNYGFEKLYTNTEHPVKISIYRLQT